MLWERISAKPLVTIPLFKLFDKTSHFAVLIGWEAPVPTNQYISTQKQNPIYFNFSAELNKLTPMF